MTIRRIIGLVMLAAALLFGAADLWHTYVPYGDSQLVTMGRLWMLISERSMNIVESLIQRHLWSAIWNFGISPILLLPAWSFFAGLGGLFFVFGRPGVADR